MRKLKLLKFLVFPTFIAFLTRFFHWLFVNSSPVLLARRAWFCSACIVFLGVIGTLMCQAVMETFDQAIERQKDRVPFRAWAAPCGECEYCTNGWQCPQTTVRAPARRRAWFDL